jgi:hypothetical protein
MSTNLIQREKRNLDRRMGRAQFALNELIREARRIGWPVTVELHEPPSGSGTIVHVALYSRNSSSRDVDKSASIVANTIPSSSVNESTTLT